MSAKRRSKQQAQDLLRYCLDHGTVIPHPHFARALADDGLDYADVLPVLQRGIVFDEPEHNVRFQQWRYKVEGREIGGRWVAIVFTFVAETETLLITAFVSR